MASVALGPEAQYVVAGLTDGTAHVWSVATGEPPKKVRRLRVATGGAVHVSISPLGLLATGAASGDVYLWDLESFVLVKGMAGHEGAVNAVEFDPRGECLATGGSDNTIRLWDPTVSLVNELAAHELVSTVCGFDAEGTRLLTIGDGPEAKIWDTRTGALVMRLPSAGSRVFSEVMNSSLAFSKSPLR